MTEIALSYKKDTNIVNEQAFIERLEFALTTQVGSLKTDPDFGFDMAGILDENLTQELEVQIKAELLDYLAQNFPGMEVFSMIINKRGTNTINIVLGVYIIEYGERKFLSVDYNGE
jgi:hypothetical protein